jgi:hypothetical protein
MSADRGLRHASPAALGCRQSTGGALTQIDVGFEAGCAAVATALNRRACCVETKSLKSFPESWRAIWSGVLARKEIAGALAAAADVIVLHEIGGAHIGLRSDKSHLLAAGETQQRRDYF